MSAAGAVVIAVCALVVGEGRLGALPGDPERPQELAVVDVLHDRDLGLDRLQGPTATEAPPQLPAPTTDRGLDGLPLSAGAGEREGDPFDVDADVVGGHGGSIHEGREQLWFDHQPSFPPERFFPLLIELAPAVGAKVEIIIQGEDRVGVFTDFAERSHALPSSRRRQLETQANRQGGERGESAEDDRDIAGEVDHHIQGLEVGLHQVPVFRRLGHGCCYAHVAASGELRTGDEHHLAGMNGQGQLVPEFPALVTSRWESFEQHALPSVVGRLSESQDGERSRTIQAAVTTPAGHFEIFGQGRWHGTKERRQSRIGEQFPESIDAHMPLRDQESVGHGVEIGVHLSTSVVGRQSRWRALAANLKQVFAPAEHLFSDPDRAAILSPVGLAQRGEPEKESDLTYTVYAGAQRPIELFGIIDDDFVAKVKEAVQENVSGKIQRVQRLAGPQEGLIGGEGVEGNAVHASDSTTPAPSEAPAPPRFLPSVWYAVDLETKRLEPGADIGTFIRFWTLGSTIPDAENIFGPVIGLQSLGVGWLWRFKDGSLLLGLSAVVRTEALFDSEEPLRVRPAVTLSLRREGGE